jgi:anti-sigma factor RsiW
MSAPGTCDGARVTAYADGVLPEEARADVERHLAECAACRDQEAFERGLRERMRGLPAPEVPPGLEQRLQRRLRQRPTPLVVRWLPLAAGLAIVTLWGRGAAPFVAWEVARDHRHCFAGRSLPAEVWSSDPAELADWYRQHGTELPVMPPAAAGVELVGGRFCPLFDRKVAHVYYASEKRHLSLYVVPGPARAGSGYTAQRGSATVRLLRTGGTTLAIVSEDAQTVDAFQRALSVSRADATPAMVDPALRALLRWTFTPVGL